mmetsp:Transcript_30907/g.66232  ORF Transcript_30907/g.66232 Transcript_30907/m.66232 type:complete len:112 (-) Transcript_30907:718-1053(-)
MFIISIDFVVLITDLDDGRQNSDEIKNLSQLRRRWRQQPHSRVEKVMTRTDILSRSTHMHFPDRFTEMKTEQIAMRPMKPFVPKNLTSGCMSEMLNTPVYSDVFFRIESAD